MKTALDWVPSGVMPQTVDEFIEAYPETVIDGQVFGLPIEFLFTAIKLFPFDDRPEEVFFTAGSLRAMRARLVKAFGQPKGTK